MPGPSQNKSIWNLGWAGSCWFWALPGSSKGQLTETLIKAQPRPGLKRPSGFSYLEACSVFFFCRGIWNSHQLCLGRLIFSSSCMASHSLHICRFVFPELRHLFSWAPLAIASHLLKHLFYGHGFPALLPISFVSSSSCPSFWVLLHFWGGSSNWLFS